MEIREEKITVQSSDKIHTLRGKIFIPQCDKSQIKGIFHIVHGMTEYIGRYDSFMRKIAEKGYICFGYDNLGHGFTAENGELGFIAHENGYVYLAKDVKVFSDLVRKEYGENLPYYLMGHSMGSFIVRLAAKDYVSPDKLVIMGTGGKNNAAGIGIRLIKLTKKLRGERYVSKFIDKMAFGSYNARFNEGDGLSWLTKDKKIRDKFRSDKFCNFKFTVSAMQDLVTLNLIVNTKEWFDEMGKQHASTPILLVAGADDPVGNYGSGVNEVYNRLKDAGCNVKLKLYENCRHEILNDTCKDEVMNDIIDFFEKNT